MPARTLVPMVLALALALPGCSARRSREPAATPEEEGRRMAEEDRFRSQVLSDLRDPAVPR